MRIAVPGEPRGRHFQFSAAHAHSGHAARGIIAEHHAVDDRADGIGSDQGSQAPVEADLADAALRGDGSGLHQHDMRGQPQDLVEL
jgi:hypothetical protein